MTTAHLDGPFDVGMFGRWRCERGEPDDIGRTHTTAAPLILDASVPDDAACLADLRRSGRVWAESDRIASQLRELAATRVRHIEITPDEVDSAAEDLLAGARLAEYGRWVYFPWSGHMVHLLPPIEFRQLRLDRNRHKITDAESDRLANLSVGIAGLSVGNAIAVTLAMEGSFGHIRLADSDRLDLSNMNRVRAAVHDIGTEKTTLAARQIWEVDPYAQVSVIRDGVTPDNIELFLDDLDIVIDECDSLEVKFAIREYARARRLPVLMATSDCGLFDVERFDDEPARPLFHGLAGDLSSSDLVKLGGDNGLTREHKAGIVVQLLEADRISSRLAASLLEIDATVSTWPQLCGDVLLGAASVAHAVRAIASDSPLPSGRHSIDLDAWSRHRAPDPDVIERKPALGLAHPARNDDVAEFAGYLVSHAVLAPSGGNAQPWHFYWDDERLWVVHDRVRSQNCLDGRHNAALLALGAATENITIAAAARGVTATVRSFPGGDAVAEITFAAGADQSLAALLPLVAQRHTNRQLGAAEPLAGDVVEALVTAAQCHGSQVHVVADPDRRAEIGQILGAGDRIRFLCAATHRDLFAELRWTDDAATRSRDGIALATLALDPGSQAAIQLIARPDVRDVLCRHNLGTRLEARRAMTRHRLFSGCLVDDPRLTPATAGSPVVAPYNASGLRPPDWALPSSR